MGTTSMIAMGLAEVREGSALFEGGLARLAEGICEAWNTSIRWAYGKGDDEVTGVCAVRDIFKGRRNEAGEVDSKFMPAIYRSICENFGVSGEFSAADKMAFSRAFTIAAARMSGAPVSFVDVKATRGGKAVRIRAVQVPASVAFKVTEESGEASALGAELVERIKSNLELQGLDVPDDADLIERAKAMPVNCIGGKHPVLGKLPSSTALANTLRDVAVAAGSMSAPKARNGSARADKFGSSLDFVTECLDMLAKGKDESEFAASDAIESKLRGVAERIAAYFAM
jgi:hypothetical protein